MRYFTKIKYANGKVELNMNVIDGENVDTVSRTSRHEPSPEFQAALQGLLRFLPDLLEIPERWFYEAEETGGLVAPDALPLATVTSVSIRQLPKSDRNAYVISFVRPIAGTNSPFTPSTPLLVEPKEGAEDDPRAELFKALAEVVRQAELYEKGTRAQLELPMPRRSSETPLDREIRRSEAEARARRMWAHFANLMPTAGKLALDDEPPFEELIVLLADYFEGWSYAFEGTEYAGLVRSASDAHGDAWCFMLTEPSLRFFFDVEAPDQFQVHAANPDLDDEGIIRWARHLWWPAKYGKSPWELEPAEEEPPELTAEALAAAAEDA